MEVVGLGTVFPAWAGMSWVEGKERVALEKGGFVEAMLDPKGWDGTVSFPILKSALSLDLENGSMDPPRGQAGHKPKGPCLLQADSPLLPRPHSSLSKWS